MEIYIKDFLFTNITQEINWSILWGTLEAYLRGFIIAYASCRKCQSNNVLLTILENNLKDATIAYNMGPVSEHYSAMMKFGYELNKLLSSPTEFLLACIKGNREKKLGNCWHLD